MFDMTPVEGPARFADGARVVERLTGFRAVVLGSRLAFGQNGKPDEWVKVEYAARMLGCATSVARAFRTDAQAPQS